MSRKGIETLLARLGLVLVVGAMYWPGLAGPFLFDDYPNIVQNPILQIDRLDLDSLRQAAKAYVPGHLGRPVATIGLALDWLAWGSDPWGYKLHSLAVHLANVLLVFALVRRLATHARSVASPSGDGTPDAAMGWKLPALIALIWAAHPLQVSTVLYIVQRMEMLCHTFVLLALLAYLRGRMAQIAGRAGAAWLAASAALAGFGVFAKESAVLFPAYALVLELTVLRFAATEDVLSRRIKVAYAAAAIAGLAVFFVAILPAQLEPAAYAFRDFGPIERVLTQFRVLSLYLGQILFPLPRYMVFYYDHLVPSQGLFDPPTTIAGLLLVAGLVAGAFALRRRMPLVSLGVLWFFASHVLTSNVIALELVFEHRNYFGLLGIVLALADLVRRIPGPAPQTAKYIAVGAVTLLVLFLGLLRAATWGSELHLHTDLVANNPGSSRASNDLATLYIGMSDGHPNSPFFDWGMREFERGSRLPGASTIAEQGLILSAASTGLEVRSEWWDRLQHKLETRPIDPQSAAAVIGLLRQRAHGIALDDARLARAYTTLAGRSSQLASSYALMGDHAINQLGDGVLAESMFLKAIDRCVGNPVYARQIVETLRAEGHDELAQSAEARAIELGVFKT